MYVSMWREIFNWIEASVTCYHCSCMLALLTMAGCRHLQEAAEKLICRQHLRPQPTGTSAVSPLVRTGTSSISPTSSIVGAERIRVSTGWAHAPSRQSVLSHRYNVVLIAQSCSRVRNETPLVCKRFYLLFFKLWNNTDICFHPKNTSIDMFLNLLWFAYSIYMYWWLWMCSVWL